MDIEKLTDAVDRARLMYWSMQGRKLDMDVKVFAEYLAKELGYVNANPAAAQPKIEVVQHGFSANAETAETPENGG